MTERAPSIDEFDPPVWMNGEARSESMSGRIPPSDLLAERNVLGNVLLDGSRMPELARLDPRHFHSEANRRIFEAMHAVQCQSHDVTLVSVHDALERTGRFGQVGGFEYLTMLGPDSAVLNRKALGECVEIILGHWRARRAIEISHRVAALGYAGSDANAVVAEAIADLSSIGISGKSNEQPWEALVTPAPAEWFNTTPAPRTWLLRDARRSNSPGVLPLGEVGQVIAEGGAGKTELVVQLAIAVATGTRWLGAFDVVTAGRVFLALGEEDAAEARRRLFRAHRAARARSPPEGSIVILPLKGVPCAMLERDERGNLVEAAFLPWLRLRLASESDWKLIVVDPQSRFAGPDAEVDNAAATRFMQSLESIAHPVGATAIDCHHTNKVSRGRGPVDGSAGRGSTGLFDGARWQCSLGVERLAFDDEDTRERLGEIVTFAVTKSNYGRKGEPVLLRRDSDNGGALLPLDDADRALVDEARVRDPVRASRAAAKETERGQTANTRQRKEDEQKRAREAAKEAERNARKVLEERALVRVLSGAPDGTLGRVELRARLKAELSSLTNGEERVIVARLGAGIERPGAAPTSDRDARPYRLAREHLPDRLRGLT